MIPRRLSRSWPFGAALLGAVYACSGTAAVTTRPGGIAASGNQAGEGANGGKGGSSANGGSSNSGGSINLGGMSAKGGKGGGKGGSSANGGTGQGGDGEGGFADDNGFGGFPDVTFDYDPPMDGMGGACDSVTGEATLRKRPMDVIVSIDNSESMAGEIKAVQDRINADFAAIIQGSGIDYRVILVSRYGNVNIHQEDGGAFQDSAYSVCIGAPLSTLACPTDATQEPAVANNPPRFYHHSTDIGSNNMWCRMLDAYDKTDPRPNPRTNFTPVAPNGWGEFLRPEAMKVFIGITDDSPSTSGTLGCSALLSGADPQVWAESFDTALRTLDPTQFEGPDGERNYVWYSIVGMAGNDATVPTPLTPADPVEVNCCRANGSVQTNCQGNSAPSGDGANNGAGYQYLSILTGGLRYPSCYNSNFDDIFNKIAEGVIEGAQVSCEYDVPTPDHGIVDFDKTEVSYEPSVGASVPLPPFASDTDCGTNAGFYFSASNTKLNLCPATCTTVQADPGAKVAIDFGCLGS